MVTEKTTFCGGRLAVQRTVMYVCAAYICVPSMPSCLFLNALCTPNNRPGCLGSYMEPAVVYMYSPRGLRKLEHTHDWTHLASNIEATYRTSAVPIHQSCKNAMRHEIHRANSDQMIPCYSNNINFLLSCWSYISHSSCFFRLFRELLIFRYNNKNT